MTPLETIEGLSVPGLYALLLELHELKMSFRPQFENKSQVLEHVFKYSLKNTFIDKHNEAYGMVRDEVIYRLVNRDALLRGPMEYKWQPHHIALEEIDTKLKEHGN